jgi:hypothetical protein
MDAWIGVDLDGTLATYHGWKGIEHIGEPIPLMVERVKFWLDKGIKVKIMTARVCISQDGYSVEAIAGFIEDWCVANIGVVLPITHEKDFGMLELWDDRCVTVEVNTGRILTQGRGLENI